jgi:hypothetical protein
MLEIVRFLSGIGKEQVQHEVFLQAHSCRRMPQVASTAGQGAKRVMSLWG